MRSESFRVAPRRGSRSVLRNFTLASTPRYARPAAYHRETKLGHIQRGPTSTNVRLRRMNGRERRARETSVINAAWNPTVPSPLDISILVPGGYEGGRAGGRCIRQHRRKTTDTNVQLTFNSETETGSGEKPGRNQPLSRSAIAEPSRSTFRRNTPQRVAKW